MENVDLVIFDMDGLMFDTERIAYAAWKEATADYGYEVTEDTLSLLFKQFDNLKSVKQYLEGYLM